MFVPTLYHDNIFDDFDNFFGLMDMPQRRDPLFGKRADRLMRTDVRETETGYELDIDLPGFKKEDVKAELKDGYLTISAQKSLEKKDGKEEGRYLARILDQTGGNISEACEVTGLSRSRLYALLKRHGLTR